MAAYSGTIGCLMKISFEKQIVVFGQNADLYLVKGWKRVYKNTNGDKLTLSPFHCMIPIATIQCQGTVIGWSEQQILLQSSFQTLTYRLCSIERFRKAVHSPETESRFPGNTV